MAKKPIESLLNLGPKSTQWLAAVNIHTRQELEEVGIVPAYWLMKSQGYPVTLNMLYALYGALHDVPWNKLPPEVQEQLKKEAEEFRFG